jgi:hypothetical protein
MSDEGSSTEDGPGGGGRTMTLAFTLDALKSLEDPAGATREAREWSDHVGIVADEPESVVRNYAKQRRIRQDFFPNSMAKRNALVAVKQGTPTARHVFVGTTVDDRAAATETGWEYRPVEEAAEKAGWKLVAGFGDGGGGSGGSSLVGAVRARLSRLF